mgnify:CR=1 FL=1
MKRNRWLSLGLSLGAVALVCGCGADNPAPVSVTLEPKPVVENIALSPSGPVSEPSETNAAETPVSPSEPSVADNNATAGQPLDSLNDDGAGVIESLVLSFDEFIAALEAFRESLINDAGGREPARTEFFDALVKRFDGYGPEARGRFVYTRFRGFIDLKHFLTACYAARLPLVAQTMVLIAGESVEYQQAQRRSPSAWSVEDLPSNAAGVEFSTRMSEPDTARALIGDLNVFFLGRLGGGAVVPADIASFRAIKNFGYSPLLDPMTAPVRESSGGIRYLSSGSDALDAERLDSLRGTAASAR